MPKQARGRMPPGFLDGIRGGPTEPEFRFDLPALAMGGQRSDEVVLVCRFYKKSLLRGCEMGGRSKEHLHSSSDGQENGRIDVGQSVGHDAYFRTCGVREEIARSQRSPG